MISRLCDYLIEGLTPELILHFAFTQIFKAIHNAYIAYLANPFTDAVSEEPDYISPPIRSKKFDKVLLDIANAQNGE